eukprot:CAMPEP_0172174512 /NCGR_PEP_ID=MMETSP1050-20130122/13711_1 /TAXON_ID=233186 /ORGANISM="Cryptomonas curvata, Strain CCAP979/52" /LENGTH=82 /DNA_ID=CAMNT_0012846507 /DNA_START=40 /DNA_END=285 /DNA_ORIENTATION=-
MSYDAYGASHGEATYQGSSGYGSATTEGYGGYNEYTSAADTDGGAEYYSETYDIPTSEHEAPVDIRSPTAAGDGAMEFSSSA